MIDDEMYDLIVIGAGASGLFSAISAKNNGAEKVLILEKTDKAGQKLLLTGDGRCNLSNQEFDLSSYNFYAQMYHKENIAFLDTAFHAFDPDKTLAFFNDMGLMVSYRNGYIYPTSYQSRTVLQVLLREAESLGIVIEYNSNVRNIEHIEDSTDYQVSTQSLKYKSHCVILASGGSSFPKTGSSGDGYYYAKKLGHTIIEPLPALTGFILEDAIVERLSGIRMMAKVSYRNHSQKVFFDTGEIQFNKYGISGIPVMNISGNIIRDMDENKEQAAVCQLSFFPYWDEDILSRKIALNMADFIEKRPFCRLEELFYGYCNEKLVELILRSKDFDPKMRLCDFLNRREDKTKESILQHYSNELERLCDAFLRFDLKLIGYQDFKTCQVTSGGICLDEIRPETMESKLNDGLYFAGEIVDVDGSCGGYNLQWAWTSAYLAGRAAAIKLRHSN